MVVIVDVLRFTTCVDAEMASAHGVSNCVPALVGPAFLQAISLT